ncbi:MAG: amidase family protein [Nodosilinea sp.]
MRSARATQARVAPLASAQMHNTAKVYVLKDWRGNRDARLAQKLRNSGAVILGKANLSEWANFVDPAMPSGCRPFLYTAHSKMLPNTLAAFLNEPLWRQFAI